MGSAFPWLDSGKFLQRLEELMDGDLSSNSALAQQTNAVFDSVEASVAVVSCGVRALCTELMRDLLLPTFEDEQEYSGEASPPPVLCRDGGGGRRKGNGARRGAVRQPAEDEPAGSSLCSGPQGGREAAAEALLGEECEARAGVERMEEGTDEQSLPEITGSQDFRNLSLETSLIRGCSTEDGICPEGAAYWYDPAESRRRLRACQPVDKAEAKVEEEEWVVV